MKFFYFLLTLISVQLHGQQSSVSKPAIDEAAIDSWISLGYRDDDVVFNGDGSFFCYKYFEGAGRNGMSILQSIRDKNKVYKFPVNVTFFFTKDNKRLLYFSENEIVDLDINSGKEHRMRGLRNISFPNTRKGEFLVYQIDSSKRWVIDNLLNPSKRLYFDSLNQFVFDKSGVRLALVLQKSQRQILALLDLHDGKQSDVELPMEEKIECLSFDNTGNNVVLLKSIARKATTGSYYRSVCSVKWGGDKLMLMADQKLSGLSENEFISRSTPYFSRDGRYIFFKVEKISNRKRDSSNAIVDIWNYQDFKLKNGCRLNKPLDYTFAVSVVDSKITRLEDDSLRMMGNNAIVGDYIVLFKPIGDRFWEFFGERKRTFWVTSLKDGSRSSLMIGPGFRFYYYSLDGKSIIYSDSLRGRWDYYAYDPKAQVTKNLTKDLPANQLTLMENNGKRVPGHHYWYEIVGWVEDTDAILIYDSFDLLKVYVSGNRKPENITNGYGRKNNIRFGLTYARESRLFKKDETLLLTAFNWESKYNGFYSKQLNKIGDPDSLSMNPWIVHGGDYNGRVLPTNNHLHDMGMPPLKAADTTLWLVRCNSDKSASNYYLTSDLKRFEKLTGIEPHLKYNWYTTELVHWKQFDGTLGSGVLFKPEDFDSTKKYPIIVYHYRELSQLLHHYSEPGLTNGPINIPWFVSRGYLVLMPDVYVQEDGSGPGAFNSVVSAAQWIGTLPFVDKYRIGLNGHSQGGFQTDYIVAHSNVFAAALSGAGGGDAIMSSFINPRCGVERFETNESRYGSIDERAEIYIKNSPFWLARNIKTPLLLFHCKNDTAVPWELSVQFFMALWRLGKPVWMLQYDEGDHLLINRRDVLDYSKRVDQFFDHFLRGGLPPEWMTKGVSTLEKGINTGLKLDSSFLRKV